MCELASRLLLLRERGRGRGVPFSFFTFLLLFFPSSEERGFTSPLRLHLPFFLSSSLPRSKLLLIFILSTSPILPPFSFQPPHLFLSPSPAGQFLNLLPSNLLLCEVHPHLTSSAVPRLNLFALSTASRIFFSLVFTYRSRREQTRCSHSVRQ